MMDKVLPQGRGSANTKELKAFSPESDNLLLDIYEPSSMRRSAALISQRESRDIVEGISNSLILFPELLLQHQEHAKIAKNEEAESLASNLSRERDQVFSSLELERNKIMT